MNYAVIKKYDIANGPGVRVSVFVSGCRHHCKNCFNKEAWDFFYGSEFTDEVIDEVIEACKKEYITGLSLLGGEPFEPENQGGLAVLCEKFKKNFPEKSIWCYTGFDFEKDLLGYRVGDKKTVDRLLNCIDVIVDGKFIEELKDLSLIFRGSSNQRIIDVKKSLAAKEVVWLEGKWQRKMGNGSIYE